MMEQPSDFILNRMKALNKLSSLLDTKHSTAWDFSIMCRIFVETVGYKSCWIALIDDAGEIKKFSHNETNEFMIDKTASDGDPFRGFVKDALSSPGEVIFNKDPLIDCYALPQNEAHPLQSLTVKLMYNNFIFGILSVTLIGPYNRIKDELLAVSDFVKTISFFLYDIDSREKIINIVMTIFETTGNATIVIEDDTTISFANKEFEELTGYSREEIENRMSFLDFILNEDREKMLGFHRQRRIDPVRAPRNYEFRVLNRLGDLKNMYMTIDMVPHTRMSIASFMDVTEKKRLESEILRVSEQERLKVGSDLHDGLGPHLVGIQFMVRLLRQKVADGVMPALSDIDEINNLITQAVEHTRTMARGLKPVDIQPDGLVFALKDFTSAICGIFSVRCDLHYDEAFAIGNNVTATHLYYIVQEAVNNAIKHARPATVNVSLKAQEHALIAEISDDGIGIPQDLDRDRGLGINIMKYRADIIGATLRINRNRLGGTSVVCTLPRS